MRLLALPCAALLLGGCAGGELEAGPAQGADLPKIHTGQRAAERHFRVQLERMHSLRGPRMYSGQPVGRSARGRPIRLTAFGTERSGPRVLVVGCIHGDECAGLAVVRRLFNGCPPLEGDVWVLHNVDPDGLAQGTRLNGRGVDLNRNFPSGWRPIGRRGDPEHSGPRPFSEPETRVAARVIRHLRPEVTVWFHQQADPLVRAWGPSIPAARRYARAAGERFVALPWLDGTAPNWQNQRFPGTSSFVVELAHGRLSDAGATRHAAAIETLAGYVGENRRALR